MFPLLVFHFDTWPANPRLKTTPEISFGVRPRRRRLGPHRGIIRLPGYWVVPRRKVGASKRSPLKRDFRFYTDVTELVPLVSEVRTWGDYTRKRTSKWGKWVTFDGGGEKILRVWVWCLGSGRLEETLEGSKRGTDTHFRPWTRGMVVCMNLRERDHYRRSRPQTGSAGLSVREGTQQSTWGTLLLPSSMTWREWDNYTSERLFCIHWKGSFEWIRDRRVPNLKSLDFCVNFEKERFVKTLPVY